jgi:hypothetical protein
MSDDTKNLLIIGGIAAVGLVLLSSMKPATSTVAVGAPSGTGGILALAGIGAATSVVDSLTGALAGQQTGASTSDDYGD